MEIPRHWRNQKIRYALVGARCEGCQKYLMPPPGVCPGCGSETLSEHQFSGRGTVYSYSTMVQGPQRFARQLPFSVALIELAEGPRIVAQLCDLGDLKPTVGMPVEMVTRKLHQDGSDGLIVYGYKFRPVLPCMDATAE